MSGDNNKILKKRREKKENCRVYEKYIKNP